MNRIIKLDKLVKSPKIPFSVIPAKAGIQFIQLLTKALDSGLSATGTVFTGVTTFYEFIKLHSDGERKWVRKSRKKIKRIKKVLGALADHPREFRCA